MATPTIGVRAEFDDSGVSSRVQNFNKRMREAEDATKRLAKSSAESAQQINQSFAVAEKSAERLDKVVRGMYGGGAEKFPAAEAAAKAEEAFRRAASSAGQFNEVYRRLGEAGGERTSRIAQRTKEAEDAVEVLADVTEDTDKRRSDSSNRANESIMRGLRSLRWETVTLLFFMRNFGAVVSGAFEMIAESAERTSQRLGAAALARTVGADMQAIVEQLRYTSGMTLSTTQAVSAVQAGFAADQGRYASQYESFWQAARIAAVTGGGEVVQIFSAMIRAIEDADAATLDAASSVFGVQDALIIYAANSGRLVEQLSSQERQQVILNTIQERTNELIAAGADEALKAKQPIEELTAAWEDLKDKAVPAATEALVAAAAFIDFITQEAPTATRDVHGLADAYDRLHESEETVARREAERARIQDEYERKVLEQRARTKAPAEPIALEIEPDKSIEDELKRRMKIAEAAVPILERVQDAVDAHNRRVERANRNHLRTLERLERGHIRDLERIDRRADIARDRAIRANERRVVAAEREIDDRLDEMIEQHNLQMLHMEQQHVLRMSTSNALYQYNRRKLIAEGDTLAIQDLDARHALEVDAQNKQYDLQRRQAEEMFKLQLKYAKQSAAAQVAALREGLKEQLDEIELRRLEEREESEIRYGEQLEAAEEAHADQLEALDESLEDQLDAIGAGLAKQRDVWDAGYQEILEVIRQVLGPGGEADRIITAFMLRMAQAQAWVNQITSTQPAPTNRPYYEWGLQGPPTRRYQYGGEGVATSPQLHMVGEGGQAEYYRYQPLGPTSGAMSISWAGPPIEVRGTGEFAGADMSAIAETMSRDMFMQLTRLHNTLRGQRGR